MIPIFPGVARLVNISNFKILMCVGSDPERIKKFLKCGSNIELFLLWPEVMDAMQFKTKHWTSVCDLKSRIMALATTWTSGFGAQW